MLLRRGGARAGVAVIHGETCRAEQALATILRGGIAKGVKGVYIGFVRSRPSSIVRRLEAQLTTYKVLLERNPASRSIEVKASILSRIVEGVVRGSMVEVVLAVVVDAGSCDELRDVASVAELAGCRVAIRCGVEASRVPGTAFLDLKSIRELVNAVLAARSPSPPPASVYIGVDEQSRAPVFLPLAEERGALHTVVVGPTGSGKTTLLATLAVRLASIEILDRIYVVDPKGDLARMLRGAGLSDDLVLYDLSQLDEEEKSAELSRLVRVLSTERPTGLAALIVDEAWRLRRVQQVFNKLYKEARAKGTAVILASQDPGDFNDTVWNNATNTILFASHSEAYLEALERHVPVPREYFEAIRAAGLGYAVLWSRVYGKAMLVRLDVEPLVLKQ